MTGSYFTIGNTSNSFSVGVDTDARDDNSYLKDDGILIDLYAGAGADWTNYTNWTLGKKNSKEAFTRGSSSNPSYWITTVRILVRVNRGSARAVGWLNSVLLNFSKT